MILRLLFLVKDNNLFLSSPLFLSQHVSAGYGKHVWLRQICYWDSFSHVSVTNQILTTFVFLFFFLFFFLSSLIFFFHLFWWDDASFLFLSPCQTIFGSEADQEKLIKWLRILRLFGLVRAGSKSSYIVGLSKWEKRGLVSNQTFLLEQSVHIFAFVFLFF